MVCNQHGDRDDGDDAHDDHGRHGDDDHDDDGSLALFPFQNMCYR